MRMLPTTSEKRSLLGRQTPSARCLGCSLTPLNNRGGRFIEVRGSFQHQQLVVARKLADVLGQQPQPATEIIAMHVSRLVEEYVPVLVNSDDWLQLQQALDDAERRCNIAAVAVAAAQDAIPDSALPDILLTTNNDQASGITKHHAQRDIAYRARNTECPAMHKPHVSGGDGNIRSQQATGDETPRPRSSDSSSPWGFALRQPNSRSSASAPIKATVTRQLLQAAQQQQQQQQLDSVQWCWSSVKQLFVLGLGSVGQFTGNATSTAKVYSRLSFRFFQLVLATALSRHLLPGLDGSPIAYDPEFDKLDQSLLTSLGFRVLCEEPSYLVTEATLLYMPCCPRQLYSQVVEANWSSQHLQHLAILGTSMDSLAATQDLYLSLTTPQSAADNRSPSSSIQQRDGPEPAAAEKELESCADKIDYVKLAYQQGRVVEVPVPDCAAHGVGVAVHLFKPQI